MNEQIIGNKKDAVYISMDKYDDYLYVCLNGFQTTGTRITPGIAKKLIPLLEEYLKRENKNES